MIHEKWVPTLEWACLIGFLSVFVFLHLVIIPEMKFTTGEFGGRLPLLTTVLFLVHDFLQPSWRAVLAVLVWIGGALSFSRVWHALVPSWPWVPAYLIIAAGVMILFFEVVASMLVLYCGCD